MHLQLLVLVDICIRIRDRFAEDDDPAAHVCGMVQSRCRFAGRPTGTGGADCRDIVNGYNLATLM